VLEMIDNSLPNGCTDTLLPFTQLCHALRVCEGPQVILGLLCISICGTASIPLVEKVVWLDGIDVLTHKLETVADLGDSECLQLVRADLSEKLEYFNPSKGREESVAQLTSLTFM
jgi:hypothetical protein